MLAQVESPEAPVLECAYEPIGDSERLRNLASIIYHTVLAIVVLIALAILVMVQAEFVDVGDSSDPDEWVEISSQIINGVFVWISITNQPLYIHRLVLISRVLNTGRKQELRVRAARNLNKYFPSVFSDKNAIHSGNVNAFEDNATDNNRNTFMNSLAENEVGDIENIVFFFKDAKHLSNTYIILNVGCLFQYVMSGYMWGYDESSRPGFVLPALIPPAILCNVVGQFRLYQLKKKTCNRQFIYPECAPIHQDLSDTRNSIASFSTLL